MIGLFKKKSKKEKMQDQYNKLVGEAYKLSHTDRRASDEKMYQAEALMKELESIVD